MGQPKALLPHPAGGTFVEYVAGIARDAADDLVLLGALDPVPPALRSVPLLPDAVPPGADPAVRRGPLAGLCRLLEHAGRGWTLLLACDLAWLRRETLMPILSALPAAGTAEPETPAYGVVAFTLGAPRRPYHPCCAAYHTALLPTVREHLERGIGSLQTLIASARVRAVTPDESIRRCLVPVNTSEDLARLHRLWRQSH